MMMRSGILVLLAMCLSLTVGRTSARKKPLTITEELAQLKKAVIQLSKQVMLQQTFAEERVRNEGSSGIKIVRAVETGLHNYKSATFLGPAAFACHDHSDYDRTIGLGEMSVVLNGVAFRTRHNDYELVQPSRTSSLQHAVEDIPFPDVPPEVLNKPTVPEQIQEMREWFQAFYKQDKSIRDYSKYFKPVMCYLEGAWTLDENIEEPFFSERHWLDAKSWEELQEKNRFITYTGVKHRMENIAFLPTTIVSVNMTSGDTVYAQWNYRILCNPINFELPLSFFHQEDDLSYRVDSGQTMKESATTRAARFKLFDPTRQQNNQILDEIFASIPGKENHGANLSYTVFSETMYDSRYGDSNIPLNTAYYHRSYKTVKNGAGGIAHVALGFNDENMWVAQTTQPRIAPLGAERCSYAPLDRTSRTSRQCMNADLRVSYAIPLEVIYMTPLTKWNPYNITIHNNTKDAFKDGRNGGKGPKALHGVDRCHYYLTPLEFFSGPLDTSDPADTIKGFLYVLAPDGEVKRVSSSGTRIVMQDMKDIGKVRLRYPIAPVHDEGSSVWKELNALKDKVKDSVSSAPLSVTFEMSLTVQEPPGEHTHTFTVTYQEFTTLTAGHSVKVTSKEAQGHTHDLTVIYDRKTKTFTYTLCDDVTVCTDGHPRAITLETRNTYTKLP
uniref:Uncharacterized protein n=1 Tax=Arion vulgaris TaxID=1028688 RepID=A0A0B7AYD9_9EUPU